MRPQGPGNPSTALSFAVPRTSFAGKHVSHHGLQFIEGFEGFESCPYWDPYGSVWTRGYGETEGIHSYSGCISRSFGEANLRSRVERFYEWSIRGIGVDFNQNQWDALCSFAWNLGAGIFRGSLRDSLRHYNPYPLLAYDHAGGQVLAGLSRRRHEEVALFLSGRQPPATKVVSRRDWERRLNALYWARSKERHVLDARQCRPGDHRHALPRHTRRQAMRSRRECNAILHAGDRHASEIRWVKRKLGLR